MPEFVWDDSYSVGVRMIDEQHKKLIAMINGLESALKEGRGRDAQREVVGNMLDYAAYHFRTEEGYMDRYAYPEAGVHKSEHELFIAKSDQLSERLAEGRFVLSVEVLDFLKAWLREHILVNDRSFGAFLNEHGMS